jgi:hypothetical protein
LNSNSENDFEFKGWDKDSENITSDTTINATWDISGIAVTPYDDTFDGFAHDAALVTGTLLGDVISYSADGAIFLNSLPQITDAGSYNFYVKVERAGYTAWESEIITAVIGAKEITADMVEAIPSEIYTGKPFEPLPEINFGSVILTKDTDFTVDYSNNTEIGLADAEITGIGNYTGTLNVKFAIYVKNTAVLIGDDQTPKVMADGLDKLFNDENIYTKEDSMIEKNGGMVDIALSVKVKTDSGEDQKKIEQIAADKNVGLYLDMSLYKTVTLPGETSGQTTEIKHTNDILTVVIPIPANIKGHKGITLYRVHDGAASLVPIGKENAMNGEYCTIDEQNITLYICNFSIYAVGYDKTKAIATGDNNIIIPYIGIAFSSFLMIILL